MALLQDGRNTESANISENGSSLTPLRPVSLEGPTSWRDQSPELILTHAEDPNDRRSFEQLYFAQTSATRSEADNSSTCRDNGDSAHLQQSSEQHARGTDPPEREQADGLSAAVGSGVQFDRQVELFDHIAVEANPSPLEDALHDAIREHPSKNGKKFIPIDKFDEIITRQNIYEELQSRRIFNSTKLLETCVKNVWDKSTYTDGSTSRPSLTTSRRKLFAVLILFGKPEWIISFIKDDLWDKDLPLRQNDETKQWFCQSKDRIRHIAFMNSWGHHYTWSFDNYQWLMLSPFFNMAGDKILFYPLDNRIALPLIEDDRNDEKDELRGGFGEVWRVKMHPAHHNYRSKNDAMSDCPSFAIKRLHTATKKGFDNEVDALKRFRNEDHVHLIKLLATYHYDGSYHLVFLWADGNLRNLWKEHPKPQPSHELASWVAEQCLGIAKGLKMIHNDEFKKSTLSTRDAQRIRGRHGDIKPENILWFRDSRNGDSNTMGVLKISDFGLSRWHRDDSNNPIYNQGLAVSRTYRAPEYDMKKPISQPWDVWALACLYLEFLTWYLCGWDAGNNEFDKLRLDEHKEEIKEDSFFTLRYIKDKSNYEARLKVCVGQWINKLHNTEGCTNFIRDFLDFISLHMLRIGSEKRSESTEVVKKLEDLCEKCRDSIRYCTDSAIGQPRKRATNESDDYDAELMDYTDTMKDKIRSASSSKSEGERKAAGEPRPPVAASLAVKKMKWREHTKPDPY